MILRALHKYSKLLSQNLLLLIYIINLNKFNYFKLLIKI